MPTVFGCDSAAHPYDAVLTGMQVSKSKPPVAEVKQAIACNIRHDQALALTIRWPLRPSLRNRQDSIGFLITEKIGLLEEASCEQPGPHILLNHQGWLNEASNQVEVDVYGVHPIFCTAVTC